VVIGQISLTKLSLSRDDRSMEAVEKHLNRMEDAADNLTRIVSGILRHAKNSAQFDNEWTQLNQVIEHELQFFDANATFKYDVEKRIDLNGDLPPVWANPLHLQQIVGNLVHNALDAMADCRPKILTITSHAEKGYVLMTICDTGTGIDPKNLPFIFQPDFTTKPPDKGTGLGLASVKAMVEGYGGRVEVHPNIPQGTKFVIMLPLKESEPGRFGGSV
jgi:signal transduction histidine kinase